MPGRVLGGGRRFREHLAVLLLGLLSGIAVWIVWPSLTRPGVLASWDAGGHLLKAQVLARQGPGWFPNWHGGFDLLLSYPPLLYWLMAPLTWIFPPEGVLRLTAAGLWLALPASGWYFLRSFGVNRVAAAAAAFLWLVFDARFGAGLGALYEVGLLPNGLGVVLMGFALGRLQRDLAATRPSTPRLAATAGVWGALVLAHTFSAYFAGLAGALLLALHVVRRRALLAESIRRCAIVWGGMLALSAWWWLPMVGTIGNMGPPETFDPKPPLSTAMDLLGGGRHGGPSITILALLGVAWLSVRRRRPHLAFLGGGLLLALAVTLNLINEWLPFSRVVASSQSIRFQTFVVWFLFGLAGHGLVAIWWLTTRVRPPALSAAGLGLAALLLVGFVFLPVLESKRKLVRVARNETTAAVPHLGKWLRDTLRPGEFILSEHSWDSKEEVGSPHLVNQRIWAHAPGVWDLGGNFPEGTAGAAEAVRIAKALGNPGAVASRRGYLESRGVRFLVSTCEKSRRTLEAEPAVRKAWSRANLTVFELAEFHTPMGLNAPIRSVTYRSGHYRIEFERRLKFPAGTTLALSYHPWMQAWTGKTKVATRPDEQHRLALAADAEGDELTLAYRPPIGTAVATSLSILAAAWALIASIAAVRRVRSRGRREAGPTSPPSRPSDGAPDSLPAVGP